MLPYRHRMQGFYPHAEAAEDNDHQHVTFKMTAIPERGKKEKEVIFQTSRQIIM